MADLHAFGFAADQVAAARRDFERAADVNEALEVLPENVVAVKLFSALRTQWRMTALSTMARAELRRTGLDYGVVRDTADLEGLRLSLPDDFHRLRFMEAEAIAAFVEDLPR